MMGPNLKGCCACGEVRYALLAKPLFTHCCHCRHCQRESGSAFRLNAMIETAHIKLLGGAPMMVKIPTKSGKGQIIARCPDCSIALWSHYGGGGSKIAFIAVGTVDNPNALPPDIHIYTKTKQPWVKLPENVPAVPGYYDRKKYWPKESLLRRRKL